jgi:hypothetical protein
MKIIRVSKTDFELEDGRIYDHPIELDVIPSIDEFQCIYDDWSVILNDDR